MGRLFGTDGIRGVANSELTPEMAYRIGRLASYFLMEGEASNGNFFIGRDTRISGTMLEGALIAGITSTGADIRRLGIVPTPAVAFLTKHFEASGGIVISASHNPVEDNGIKFFDRQGYKLSEKMEEKIENYYLKELDKDLPRPTGKKVGRLFEEKEAINHYIEAIQNFSCYFNGFKVVIDCAHGAVYDIAPKFFRSLGADITAINCFPNGININLGCGSTSPEILRQAVQATEADIGLAFDGDADRLIAVDRQGGLVDGDAVMAICATYYHQQGRLNKGTLVATILSNGGLDIAAQRMGYKVVRTKVGDRFVLEEIVNGGYNLGGEQSGHIIFHEYNTTGDGLLTAVQLLNIMRETGEPLSNLALIYNRFPQLMVNCKVFRREGWEDNPYIQEAIESAYKKLGDFGRIIIRPSGTEPLMRIMVEGQDEQLLHNIANSLALVISTELN